MKNKMEYAYGGGASADTGSTFGLSGAAGLNGSHDLHASLTYGAVVVEYGLYYQGGAECFQKLLERKWPVAVCAQRGMRMLGRPAIPDLCFSSGRGLLPYTQPEALRPADVSVCPHIRTAF